MGGATPVTVDDTATAICPTTSTPATTVTFEQDPFFPKKTLGLSTADISNLCFPSDYVPVSNGNHSPSSASSSALHNEEESLDETQLQRTSMEFYAKIDTIEFSRAGRDYQKWSVQDDHRRTRHVTGTVPILRDGRVLVISSRRKPTWILPKGGWEVDETLPESALRETFEEAGVWGTLGKPYPAFVYPAGRTHNSNNDHHNTVASSPLLSDETTIVDPPSDDSTMATSTTDSRHHLSNDSSNHNDNKSIADSSESDNNTKLEKPGKTIPYTHVELVLFPLYVKEVRDEWPEQSFRKRQLLTVEQAMVELKERPEFVAALRELQRSREPAIPNTHQ